MSSISDIGEFGLIRRLTEKFPLRNASSLRGVGDDAAVIDNGGRKTLVTTDILLEGIHFNLEYVPLKHLGYKAAVVNFSDIYAMNGKPEQIVVSLGVSARFSVEMLDELYEGIRLACDNYGVDLVGGDTSSSLTGLTISVTCIGSADEQDIVYRDGAKDGNLICVSGNLGAAYLGLQLLERERIVLKDNAQSEPNFAGYEYLLQRQLKPEARRDIIDELREAGIRPTAMMDVSDGLSSEVMHICTQSGVGCRIYEDKLPIDYQAAVLAEEMNLNIVTCALNGGEDYELLFTCPISDYEKLLPLDKIFIIGHVTDKGDGMNLVSREGQLMTLQAQGWKAF